MLFDSNQQYTFMAIYTLSACFLTIFVLDNRHIQVTLDWSNINYSTGRDNFFQLFYCVPSAGHVNVNKRT